MKSARLMFLVATLVASNAAHSASCEELAGAFAKDAGAMSDTELGRLRTCVSDTLRHRLTGKNPAAPAPKASPPPPPPAASRPVPAPPPPPAPGPPR